MKIKNSITSNLDLTIKFSKTRKPIVTKYLFFVNSFAPL